MPLTTDPSDPRLGRGVGGDGLNEAYLVLSDEERAKGFLRPVRTSYVHVGISAPQFPLRDLTEDEQERYGEYGYVKFEEYPEEVHGLGRFWTQEQLDSVGKGCGVVTTMAQAIAETYARNPQFYGATFCAGCNTHLPVGEHGEFVWDVGGAHIGMTAEQLREIPRVGT